MNSSYSEGVLVKNANTGEVLTIDMMINTIKGELSKHFYNYPSLVSHYDMEDVLQDVVCYYFSSMKKTDKMRLTHYSELYDNNINYLINLFKLTSRQWLNMLCRGNEIKANPISLNSMVTNSSKSFGDSSCELQDLVKDNTLDKLLDDNEFLIDMQRLLHEYNVKTLYTKFKKTCRGRSDYCSFISNPNNLIEVQRLTSRQYSLLEDFLEGFSKAELKRKYDDYARLFKVLKLVLTKRVENV